MTTFVYLYSLEIAAKEKNERYNEKTFSCDCPEGFKWDGTNCVLCTSGKSWDPFSRTCICPPGTQWNNQFCAVIENCRGAMIWNQNTWAC